MAVRMVDVKLTTDYSWADVKKLADWNAVKNTNKDWQQLLQTAIPGGIVEIEVEVSENNWLSIKDNHRDWQHIKDRFATWLDVRNY